MLAEIIRGVSGKPWTEYVQEKIFKPAGMSRTAPTNAKLDGAPRAVGYGGNDNARRADDWTALRPSGAFMSTVLDLAKWDAALYTDSVLNAAAREQMSTAVKLNDGTTAPYGFGVHVDSAFDQKRVWHGGGMPGFVSQFIRYGSGLTVIVLTNGDDVDLPSVAEGVAAPYLRPK
jgi:CubicO group peptidase (beta-lactamase class C family)